MKRWLALAALALCAQPASAGAAESHHDLAVRAVKAGYEQQIADRIMEVFWPVALQVIKERIPGVTDVQLFQYQGKATTIAAEAAHNGLGPMVELFENGFTDDELTAVAAFYESPAGIKFNGAEGLIVTTLSGPVGDSLKLEINGLRQKVDDMLAADGY
jgi:hypothetical protein